LAQTDGLAGQNRDPPRDFHHLQVPLGRPSEYRLKLADGIVDACVDVLKVPRKWVLIEFTPHVGGEIYRDGKWVADWTPEEGAPFQLEA
jgi:hypothetical protein